ncbi:hypothetical protein SFC07_10940 [Corynebacterium callunae]|uniref:hypothetical protein n=1 Tax=Corynebacterium callunae TaxID=1721 RepID=UPI0039826D0F
MLRTRNEGALALMVIGLLGQIREEAGQDCVDVSDDAAFRGKAEQGFHDRQNNRLRIAELGWEFGGPPNEQEIEVGMR